MGGNLENLPYLIFADYNLNRIYLNFIPEEMAEIVGNLMH
jgi:hypothetical protein